MNGTSMASPCAAGVAALVLSVARVAGDPAHPPTPARVRRALENTASPVGGLATGAPDGRLTYGAGLVQADAAAAYLLADLAAKDPVRDARYSVSVRRADGGPTGRGLLLREPDDTVGHAAVAATVTLTPKFHPRAAPADASLSVEQRLALTTTAPWLDAPPSLLLPGGGRSFEISVDVASLAPGSGLHFAEVVAVDTAAPERGPLVRVPVTVVRPLPVPPGGDLALGDVAMSPGAEARAFVAVPAGASWAILRAKPAPFASDADGRSPPRGFMLRLTAHAPHERYTDTEARTYATLAGGEEGHLVARVDGGSTLEVTVAQFWSSGGDGPVALDLSFHGLAATPSVVALGPSSDACRVSVRAGVRPERFAPRAKISRLRRALRPHAPGVVSPLSVDRDTLPRGRLGHGLLLTHTLDVVEGGGTYEVSMPLLSSLVYDSPLDGVTTIAYDAHKQRLGVSDAYPAKIRIPGSVKKATLRTLVRSDDPSLLAGLASASLQVDRLLDAKLDVPLYASHADAVRETAAAGGRGDDKKKSGGDAVGEGGGGDAVAGGGGDDVDAAAAAAASTAPKDRTLHTGERVAFFVGPLPDAKLPKDAALGSVMVGSVTLGKVARRDGGGDAPGALPLTVTVGPPKPAKPDAGKEEEEEDKEGGKEATDAGAKAEEARDAALRDALVSHLRSLAPKDEAEAVAADSLFADALAGPHGKHLALLAAHVSVLASLEGEPRTARAAATVAAADAVAAAVDIPALHAAAARVSPDDAPGAAARKKETDLQRKALVDALVAKAEALRPSTDAAAAPSPAFTAAVAELRAWLGDDDPRAARLAASLEQSAARPARALALLDKAVAKATTVDRAAAVADAGARVDLLEALGAPHAAAAARERCARRVPGRMGDFLMRECVCGGGGGGRECVCNQALCV